MDVQISFRGMAPSPSAEAQVRERVAELQTLTDRITTCRVTLEMAHRHHRHGNVFHVRVDLAVPGGHIIVSREPGQDHAHEDMHVSIRDAFDIARRRLQDHMDSLNRLVRPQRTA